MRSNLRRYPALGFLAAAALLASLLPSALRVPLSGPTASAELAPVPGKSDSAQGDLAALGQTSTGGLGSGSGIGGSRLGSSRSSGGDDGLPPASSPPPGSGRNPRQKRCVGNPPRQTEDPFSPPCVAYFKGDNFGATAKGVTGDEVRVFWSDNLPCAPRDYSISEWGTGESDFPARGAFVRYFNDRFQTYGRKVRFFRFEYDGCAGNSPSAFRAFWERIDAELDPFFVLNSYTSTSLTQVDEAARLGMMTSAEGASRAVMQRMAPYLVSYVPDLEHRTAAAVEAVCARLAGRPARFHGDPAQRDAKRKFGLVYSVPMDPDNAGADLLVQGLRERCGREVGEVEIGYVAGRGQRREDIWTRFHLAGVTTVLYSDRAFGGFNRNDITFADSSGWQGEWFVYPIEGSDILLPPGQASRFFGLLQERRMGPRAEHPHYRAAVEGGYPTEAESGFTPVLHEYNSLLLLFTGIQGAGPRLTPANFNRGLRAMPVRQSRDPFVPSAYFGPGDYSFVKDHAFVWWDPAGRAPWSARGFPGCWRLVEDGLRYRPQDWASRPGDDGIHQRIPEQPCQAVV